MTQEKISDIYDIEAIRKEVGELQKTLNWYSKRGGLLPYDWTSYGHPHIVKLLRLCKIKYDGELRKKDVRGAWR